MKILLIGPQPMPITGESLANKVLLEELVKNEKIKVEAINTAYKELKEDIGVFKLKKVLFYLIIYWNLIKISKYDKIYITIGQTFWGVVKYSPFMLIAKILGKSLIIHIHGNNIGRLYNKLKGIRRYFIRRTICLADKGIVLSQSLKNNLTPFLSGDNIFVVQNFVEDYLFNEKLLKNYDELKLLYFSNLMKEKGIIDFLNALLILQEKRINFKARIAGGIDSSSRKEIKELFNKVGEDLKYEGVVFNEEKKELLEWGNVFVFPTYYKIEGQPISLLEAMATGNIVLTTRHGGIPDIFKNGVNGFYIEKNNPCSIADKLIELSKNLSSYNTISMTNIKDATHNYRVKMFVIRLQQIFEV